MADSIEEIIQRAKQELEQMIDLNPQAMLLVDSAHRVGRANRALLEFLGLAGFKDVLDKRLEELFPGQDEFFAELLSGSGYTSRELGVDVGTDRHRALRFRVVGAGEGGHLSAMIIEDITRDKALAAELERQHKTEAVGPLVGALMHRINQPLTVITVRTKLMQMALDRGELNREEFRKTLSDIGNLAMEISDVLRRARNAKTFVTVTYDRTTDILDLERAGEADVGSE
jgi:nitrogen-specific signal transduction histidine kinase